MANLFSPRDTDGVDDYDMSEEQEYDPIPRPDNSVREPVEPGRRRGFATPANIVRRNGRRISVINLTPMDMRRWSDQSLQNLAYLGQSVAASSRARARDRAAFGRDNAGARDQAVFGRARDYPPPVGGWGQLQQLAGWIDAANTARMPPDFETAFRDAEQEWYDRYPPTRAAAAEEPGHYGRLQPWDGYNRLADQESADRPETVEDYVNWLTEPEPHQRPATDNLTESELLDWLLSGGAPSRLADQESAVRHPAGSGEPEPSEPEVHCSALEQFLNLRVGVAPGGGPPRARAEVARQPERVPSWLVINGEWTTEPPKGKKVRDFLATLKPGQCSLRALFHARAALAKDIKDINPDDWTYATVGKMIDFLNKRHIPSRFFDGMGRIVYSQDWVGSKHKVKFRVAGGHVMAFTSRCSKPEAIFTLVGDSPSPMAEVFNMLGKHFGLRSTVSIWNREFYDLCNIRAPIWTPENMRASFCYDMNKAYPSIMCNPNCIFPLSNGGEIVSAFEPQLMNTRELIAHGFYEVNIQELTRPTTRPGEEHLIIGASHGWGWMYGDVLVKAYPDADVLVRGSYITEGFTTGRPLSLDDGSALATLMRSTFRTTNPGDDETKLFFNTLVTYSGMIESTASSTTLDINAPLEMDEWNYYNKASEEIQDATPRMGDDNTNTKPNWSQTLLGRHLKGTRDRTFSIAGQLAKLAIYSYVRLALLEMFRDVVAAVPGAYLTRLATDSISFYSEIDCSDIESFNVSDKIGPLPGQFKLQPTVAKGNPPRPIPINPPAIPMYAPSTAACLQPPPAVLVDLEDLYAAFWERRMCSAAVFGPPGSGKTTQVLKKEIIPSLRKHSLTPVLATKTSAHAERLGGVTLGSILSPKLDTEAQRRALSRSVIIIDEAGMSSPSDISNIRDLHPAGIVLVGDPRQLTSSGCLVAIARTLKLPIAWTAPHSKDRFGGSAAMRNVLSTLETKIDEMIETGVFSGDPLAIAWPHRLEADLEAAGLRFVDSVQDAMDSFEDAGPIHVLGYRRKYTYENKTLLGMLAKNEIESVSTVHKAQGQTLEGNLIITDFRTDPRLIYTAISRATSINKVAVLRDPLSV